MMPFVYDRTPHTLTLREPRGTHLLTPRALHSPPVTSQSQERPPRLTPKVFSHSPGLCLSGIWQPPCLNGCHDYWSLSA